MSAAVPFELLCIGRFAPGALRIEWRDEARPTAPELEQLIAREWERRVAEAGRAGKLLFNGKLARYLHHKIRGECLHVHVGPTDYRDFVGTNLYNSHRLSEFGRERFANPVGTTGLIITTDEKLVLGRRSGWVAYHAGHLHTIGGGLEAGERRGDGSIDGFASVMRELAEEVGLTEAELGAIVCVGLARDTEIQQPELLFEARVHVTSEALATRLDRQDPHQEHERLEWCEDGADAIVAFLRRARPVAPVAVASLLLHGRLAWGEAWYSQACTAV